MWYAGFKNSLKTRSGGFLVFFGMSFLIAGMILSVGLGTDLSLSLGEPLQVKDKAQPTADLEQEPLFSGAFLVGQPSAALQNVTFTQVAKIARPAVVNISTVVKAESRTPMRSPHFSMIRFSVDFLERNLSGGFNRKNLPGNKVQGLA